jgi:hypothetical protein
MNHRSSAAAEMPATALQCRKRRGAQARRQQGGLERWRGRKMTRGRGRAGGGRRRPGAEHCAVGRAPEGRAEGRGARRKKGERMKLGTVCKIREKQGPHCKELVTFKPVPKWRWSKKQKCIVFQTLPLLFKVHLQLSNSFEDTINLVIFSNFK